MEFMIGSYNVILIIFSVIIGLITCFSTLDLFYRHTLSAKRVNGSWLVSGAMVLGIGVWCSQLLGILAYRPTNQMPLDLVYVIFSLFVAIIGSYFALSLLNLKKGMFLFSILFGPIIGMIYFLGFEAFHGNIILQFNVALYCVAILIGCTGFYLAFWCAKYLKNKNISPLFIRLISGTSFALSVAVIRLLMRKATLVFFKQQTHITNVHVNMEILALCIGSAVILLLILVLFGSYILETLSIQSLQLETNEQYYQSLYDHNPDMILTMNMDGEMISVNKNIIHYGYTEEEWLNKSFTFYIVPDQLEKAMEDFQAIKKGEARIVETAIFGKNGDRFELSVASVPIIIKDEIVGIYCIVKDVTELKRAQATLTEAEDKYRRLTENSGVGTYITQDGKFVYANPKLIEMLGYDKDELIGKNVIDFVYPEDHPLIIENAKKRQQDISASVEYQYRFIKKDNSLLHVENFGSAMNYRGKPAAIGTIVDLTSRKEAEEIIEFLAYHDTLTGLLYRNHFYNQLDATLSKGEVESLAIMFIDLDDFKIINDALGHMIGDRLFREVSERLRTCVGSLGEMGRNRGDEFLVSLPDISKEEAAVIAKQMIASLAEPFHVDQYELYVSPSIGMSFYPRDTEDSRDLIIKAETAMYQVKKSGKNNYQFYKSGHQEQSFEKLDLEIGLRKALEHEEFILHYQPKMDLNSGKVIGVEALIRWNHPVRGFVSPAEFIPMAEEMGLIIPIGEWVIRTACKQTKAWHEAGLTSFIVSVNLSVRQLYQPNLVEMIGQVLAETNLEPKYLELEITESLMVDSDHALKILKELKGLGVKISLDDFGTGFSSLHYLKDAPFDILKIDQSFVRQCTDNTNDATIVKTVIAMAHQLNLEVVAEGVETTEHLIFLQQNLCEVAQGYLFSKPLPPEELVQQLEKIEKIIEQYGIPKDLQNRKWMEKTLEIARQELVDTIRYQHGMTFKFIEEDGKFIHTLCDGELLYRVGLVPEQIIGRELKDILPPDEAERLAECYHRAWMGEENVSYEMELNGIFFLATLRPVIRSGKIVEVIASCIDITERKKIEEALKESEAKYRLITDNMMDLIEIWDTNGLVKYASPSHEKVLGHPHHSFEGRPAFSLVHPEDQAHVQTQFEQMMVTKEPIQIQFRCRNAYGKWVNIDAQCTTVLGEEKQVEHVVVVGRDVSERTIL